MEMDYTVKERIPYDQVLAAADEYCSLCYLEDEKTGYAYKSRSSDIIMDYVIVKYVSSIDMSNVDVRTFYDSYDTEMVFACRRTCAASEIYKIAYATLDNAVTTHNHGNTIGAKLLEAFGSVLNGGDLLEQFSQSKDINDQMIEILANAKKGAEMNPVTKFPWAAKK